jgi:hypothetical protein
LGTGGFQPAERMQSVASRYSEGGSRGGLSHGCELIGLRNHLREALIEACPEDVSECTLGALEAGDF